MRSVKCKVQKDAGRSHFTLCTLHWPLYTRGRTGLALDPRLCTLDYPAPHAGAVQPESPGGVVRCAMECSHQDQFFPQLSDCQHRSIEAHAWQAATRESTCSSGTASGVYRRRTASSMRRPRSWASSGRGAGSLVFGRALGSRLSTLASRLLSGSGRFSG